MNPYERIASALRHSSLLESSPIWDLVRPLYDKSLRLVMPRGMKRTFGGTDTVYISRHFSRITEDFERDTWPAIMSEIKSDDCVIDVGAFIGLYSISLSKRGCEVHAVEPDPSNYSALLEHLKTNDVSSVTTYNLAIGDADTTLSFNNSANEDSCVGDGEIKVECRTLDSLFPDSRVDVIKIDTEGFERQVLEGAKALLTDIERRPRVLFIEVHPFAWERFETTSQSLLALLDQFGYAAFHLNGSPVNEITEYGEISARPKVNSV